MQRDSKVIPSMSGPRTGSLRAGTVPFDPLPVGAEDTDEDPAGAGAVVEVESSGEQQTPARKSHIWSRKAKDGSPKVPGRPKSATWQKRVGDGFQAFQLELQGRRNQDFARKGYAIDDYKKSRRSVYIALRELVIYLVFMVVFGLTSSRYLFNGDVYNMGAGLSQQITEGDFNKEHLHVSRSFKEIKTIEDIKWWVLGPVSDFLNNNYNGDGNKIESNQMPFNYNVFMGPVRISQLRAQEINCNNRVPPFMAGYDRAFLCYDGGGSGHQVSVSTALSVAISPDPLTLSD
jgi:hypothetical protein